MLLVDSAGAALTALAVVLLLAGGYLLALALLREEVGRDRLTLAIATLLLATAQAVAIATLLGALGLLRLPWALALQTALVALLDRLARRQALPGGPFAPARAMLRATWTRAVEHPALSLVVAHAVASEALRGLLRPPLSWDSLMYHLLLAATWLRDGNLEPVFGSLPINYFGYVPANGSLWLWWWMAPSHSELYVNLAALPHWLLLGLTVGALARRLGADRWWPLAALLVAVTPAAVRFVATQYVDLLHGALVLGALHFGLRWCDQARWRDAAMAAVALGLAGGTKVLGGPYAAFLALSLLPLVRGDWGRRLVQAAGAVGLAALLGGYFYARNLALGVHPLAVFCGVDSRGMVEAGVSRIPRPDSLLDLGFAAIADGQLIDAFLGVSRPQLLELGVGPQTFALLLALVALPWAVARERRREAVSLLLFIALMVGFWIAVPYAANRHLLANVRYLSPAFGIALAAGVTALARRPAAVRWLPWIALALGLQGLLQLHAEMPRGVRLAIAAVDCALVVFAWSTAARAWAARRWPAATLAAAGVAILLAPAWARFRIADRGRALAEDTTAHRTVARLQAAAWEWLDRHGGDGNVATVGTPGSYFVYPAMGPRLQRDVRMIEVGRAQLGQAALYPSCDPRSDPDPAAWLAGLARHQIRWIHLSRFPGFDLPLEDAWARGLPHLFVRRFADDDNVVYERVAPAAAR